MNSSKETTEESHPVEISLDIWDEEWPLVESPGENLAGSDVSSHSPGKRQYVQKVSEKIETLSSSFKRFEKTLRELGECWSTPDGSVTSVERERVKEQSRNLVQFARGIRNDGEELSGWSPPSKMENTHDLLKAVYRSLEETLVSLRDDLRDHVNQNPEDLSVKGVEAMASQQTSDHMERASDRMQQLTNQDHEDMINEVAMESFKSSFVITTVIMVGGMLTLFFLMLVFG